MCEDPSPPQYGTVTVETYGHVKKAVYHCNHGYDLVGSNVVECRYGGEYSGPQPVCKREYSYVRATPITLVL